MDYIKHIAIMHVPCTSFERRNLCKTTACSVEIYKPSKAIHIDQH